jgi:hypothetical protein
MPRFVGIGSCRVSGVAGLLAILLLGFGSGAVAQVPPITTPPEDKADANHPDIPKIYIGPLLLTGSVMANGQAIVGDDEGQPPDELTISQARIGISGNITPLVGWGIGAALTDSPSLRTAFVLFRFAPAFHVRFGQATPPTALERGTSTSILEPINRSPPTNQLTGGGDIGLTIQSAQPIKGWVGYALNVNNGTGSNKPDNNDAKTSPVKWS